ncbi:MAG: arylsulfatase [Pirellulaceae bacterium]
MLQRTSICLIWSLLLFAWNVGTTSASDPPNVLLILVDDMGYSDLGCFGSEIETPNLDGLAQNGVRFTQFYNTARCWPTRAALLTGYYAQQVRRDTLPDIPSGSRGKRPQWAGLLPAYLKASGYRSYHSGKWHLDGMPLATGFDRSYYLRDQGRFFNPRVHHQDDKKLPAVALESGFYATTAIADHAVSCLQDHAKNHSEKPFFHYLAFTAPHFPLHALPADIARYEGRYDKGWNELRSRRWLRMTSQNLVPAHLSDAELDLGPPYDFPDALTTLGSGEVNRPLPWNQLAAVQQKFQANKMELHAAMVDRVDQEVGRVLEVLRKTDQYDNTLIMFLSDNGASAEIMVRDDGHDPQASPGSARTYLCLGPGWSTMCNTPFRRHKTWVHEGGISTSFIAHWPGRIVSGTMQDQPCHVIDVAPTILELAGIDTKALETDVDGRPTLPGASLVPFFHRNAERKERDFWWFHDGHRAVRQGDWKLVAAKGEAWELYDLTLDRSESVDVSAKYPDRVKDFAASWRAKLDDFVELAKQSDN